MVEGGNNGRRVVIPIQSCKLPSPRHLEIDETREKLTTWLSSAQHFFSQDDAYKHFVQTETTWDKRLDNYGFAAEPDESRLHRTAPEMRDAFLRFCSALSAFFPYTFLSRKFTNTTNWAGIKRAIYVAYNQQLTASTFLQYNDIKRAPNENYYIFYERIYDHFVQHLAGPNITADDFTTGNAGDAMTCSHANLIAMFWLEKIDRRLPKVVMKEYATDLRRADSQLITLVPRIAGDMDALLDKLDDSKIQRFTQRGGGSRGNFGGGRSDAGGGRTQQSFPQQFNTSRQRGRNAPRGGGRSDGRDRQSHCSHCQQLAKELKFPIPYDHSPLGCQRRRVQVRLIVDDQDQDGVDGEHQEGQEDEYEYEADGDEFYGTGDYGAEDGQSAVAVPHDNLSNFHHLQVTDPVLPEESQSSVDTDVLTLSQSVRSSSALFSLIQRASSVSELPPTSLTKVSGVLRRFHSRAPAKAASPRLVGEFEGNALTAVIDEGSELNCIDYQFARDMNVGFTETQVGATAAGDNPVDIAGVTSSNFIFYTAVGGQQIPIDCQRAVVVRRLGTDVLVGEPAKCHNDIQTSARSRSIILRYKGHKYWKPYLDNSCRPYSLARLRQTRTVCSGSSIILPVPASLSTEKIFLLTPRRGQTEWFRPGFYSQQGGALAVTSTSSLPTTILRDEPFGDIRTCTEVKLPRMGPGPTRQQLLAGEVNQPGQAGNPDRPTAGKAFFYKEFGKREIGQKIPLNLAGGRGFVSGAQLSSGTPADTTKEVQIEIPISQSGNPSTASKEPAVRRVATYPSSDFRYRDFSTPEPQKPWTEPDIVLDPDNTMPESAKKLMRDISNKFSQVFNKRPGKYNGYYGRVDNSINFASPPVPNLKVYSPNYSDELRRKLGELMDKMIDYGVLARPEDVGVIPEIVSSTLIVPKLEKGEYRMVTDFSQVNKHIRKYPSTSPTIADAKRFLARKRFFIHLDLSNFFFQSGIAAEDSQYLCTMHPFKGLYCYVVEPQGLRNASEHGYELLNRVFGDMESDGRLARIADSLYPAGDTYEELADSYEEALRRADLCGLHFKPGKVIICPREAVLFGWKLTGTEWKPTTHTTSALVAAKPPSTVNGLRSFLGSFKQFAECVPKYAVTLHDLEQLVGGRASAERIQWTDDNLRKFEQAKLAAADVNGVHVPKPDDQLHTYSDYSEDGRAVGGRLEIIRTIDGKETKLLGGYFSVILDKFKQHWAPCEAEAAGVRLVLLHFEPFIRENKNTTIHYTDNMPTVQAWKRLMQGKFSHSSRISTFLINLSSMSVEVRYRPGKLMASTDYTSRHPVACAATKCQICAFAKQVQAEGDDAARVRILFKDVLEGRAIMPYIQLKSWLGVQLNDWAHTNLRRLVSIGQHPDSKKTKGDYTVLKKLYNLYQSGDLLIRADGLIMIKARDGYFNGYVVSVPHNMFPGIAFSLHVKLGHPSKGQLTNLMSRYFYSYGGPRIINMVVDNCVQCRSVQQVPAVFAEDTTEQVEALGTHFAIDVMERNGQKIFLAREKLSQHTWLEIIPDQTVPSLRQAIVKTILPWAHNNGARVRCDGATALQSLANSAEEEGSVFRQYKIVLEVGRVHNPNKNAIAENAIKEAEKEILKHKPDQKTLTPEDIVVVAKIMNERIRNRGVASKEILTRRDLITNKPKNIKDDHLRQDQFEKRIESNHQSQQRRSQDDRLQKTDDVLFHIGDIVYVKSQKSKNNAREQFIIVGFPEDMVKIQKLHSRLGAKTYMLYRYEIMHANAASDQLYEKVRQQEELLQEEDQAQADQAKPTATETPQPAIPQKRPRGRPRKSIIPRPPLEDRRTEETPSGRPVRSAATKAREKFRGNSEIFLVEPTLRRRTSRAPRASDFYRPGTRPLDDEEMVTTTMIKFPKPRYWPEPAPVNNYSWLDDEGWTFPDFEDWASQRREFYVVSSLRDIAIRLRQAQNRLLQLQEEDPEDQNNQDQLQIEEFEERSDQDQQQTEEEFQDALQDLEQLENLDEDLEDQYRDLQRLSRNPENVNQINMGRVVNLSNIIVDVSDDPETPPEQHPQTERNDGRRRSSRSTAGRKPGRFRDYRM